MTGVQWVKPTNAKLTKKSKLRGRKLRGLRQNQITPNFIYRIDHRYKMNTFSDFENESPKLRGPRI